MLCCVTLFSLSLKSMKILACKGLKISFPVSSRRCYNVFDDQTTCAYWLENILLFVAKKMFNQINLKIFSYKNQQQTQKHLQYLA